MVFRATVIPIRGILEVVLITMPYELTTYHSRAFDPSSIPLGNLGEYKSRWRVWEGVQKCRSKESASRSKSAVQSFTISKVLQLPTCNLSVLLLICPRRILFSNGKMHKA